MSLLHGPTLAMIAVSLMTLGALLIIIRNDPGVVAFVILGMGIQALLIAGFLDGWSGPSDQPVPVIRPSERCDDWQKSETEAGVVYIIACRSCPDGAICFEPQIYIP